MIKGHTMVATSSFIVKQAQVGVTSQSAALAPGDSFNLSRPHRLMCKLGVKTVSTS